MALPLRETCLRVDTLEGASWMTELALPREGNGLGARPDVDAPGCASPFSSTSGMCKELHSRDMGAVEDEGNGTGASFLLCDGA